MNVNVFSAVAVALGIVGAQAGTALPLPVACAKAAQLVCDAGLEATR